MACGVEARRFTQPLPRPCYLCTMAARMVAMVAAMVMMSMPAMGASRVGALVERAQAKGSALSLGDEVTEAARYAGKLHKRFNEIKYLAGHTKRNDYVKPLPHTYVGAADFPEAFHWGNVSGRCGALLRNVKVPHQGGTSLRVTDT